MAPFTFTFGRLGGAWRLLGGVLDPLGGVLGASWPILGRLKADTKMESEADRLLKAAKGSRKTAARPPKADLPYPAGRNPRFVKACGLSKGLTNN